jgi:hypothetical protein
MRRIFSAVLVTLFTGSLFAQQTMPLGPYGKIPAVSGNASTATATLTPGQMSTVMINANAGAATLTTPSATLLCRLFPFVGSGNSNNFWWDWYLINNGTMTVTVAVGSGVTNTPSTGTLTVAAASVKHFMIVLTGCTGTPAAQIISLGTSVF